MELTSFQRERWTQRGVNQQFVILNNNTRCEKKIIVIRSIAREEFSKKVAFCGNLSMRSWLCDHKAKIVPGRQNSLCKGPEVGRSLFSV